MGDWYEEPYGYMIIIGIALVIGGLIFMFLVYPAFFSHLGILYTINIIGLILGIILVVAGIIWAIKD